ncbi:putative F-box protein [Forsythia ovata]|uniref:F-box protein n=1 Tax=Forsythia ovata TaxID=205694 RepID=A0ABD1SQM4_9LAMI
MAMDPMDHFGIWDNEQKPRHRGVGGGGDRRDAIIRWKSKELVISCDLIIEILSRLPAKILCKFRCVSKEWHNLLNRDKEFAARHIKWSKQNPLFLIRRYV